MKPLLSKKLSEKLRKKTQISCRQWTVTVFFFLLTTLLQSAQSQESIDLFLPLSSNDQAEFIAELQAAFKNNGLTNIIVKSADHWHDYQQGLRHGRQGIYFAAPHFNAWAINRHGFKPLLRIAEPISYVIITKRSQTKLFEINDLVNHQVCSMQPLELDYLILADAFDNTIGSIYHHFIETVSDEMTDKQSSCDGFVVSNHVLQKLSNAGNSDYIRLYQSQNHNNYAFIAHPNVTSQTTTQLSTFLTRANTRGLIQPLLERYANETTLIKALPQDYPASYTNILSNYWHEQ